MQAYLLKLALIIKIFLYVYSVKFFCGGDMFCTPPKTKRVSF